MTLYSSVPIEEAVKNHLSASGVTPATASIYCSLEGEGILETDESISTPAVIIECVGDPTPIVSSDTPIGLYKATLSVTYITEYGEQNKANREAIAKTIFETLTTLTSSADVWIDTDVSVQPALPRVVEGSYLYNSILTIRCAGI